jgi:hypothetical protein
MREMGKFICARAARAFTFLLQQKKVNKKCRRFRKKSKNHSLFLKIAKLAALRQRNFFNEKQSDFLNGFFLRRNLNICLFIVCVFVKMIEIFTQQTILTA